MQSFKTPQKYGSSKATVKGTSDHLRALFLSVLPLTLTSTVCASLHNAKVLSETCTIQGSFDFVLLVGNKSVCFPLSYKKTLLK